MAVEVDLPILLGKLQNLLIAGELPDSKLLADEVSMSIEVLELISAWIRDAKKEKDVIDTFVVKTELRWGRKLIKMTMMRSLISFKSLQDKTVLSVEVGKLKRAAAKLQRFENFEEDLEDISDKNQQWEMISNAWVKMQLAIAEGIIMLSS